MTELAKIISREYKRAWRNKNRDLINAYNRLYRAKNKDKVKMYNINYWEKKAQNIEIEKLFADKNKEEILKLTIEGG